MKLFCSLRKDLENYNVELKTTFLIDDHTSLIKVNYSNSSYDFRGQEAQLFGPIAKNLKDILLKYLNEIKMPTVPLIVNHYDLPDSTDELKVILYKFLYFYFQMQAKIN